MSRTRHTIQHWLPYLKRLKYTASLTPQLQEKLYKLTQDFLRSKTFEGAGGLKMTDRIRLEISIQACLLILNLGLEYYDHWRAIIVYPDDFLVKREIIDEDGVVHSWVDELSGESWDNGPVILSWASVIQSELGTNIVLHEFAHKLDSHDGSANGCPPLPVHISPSRWADTFSFAYKRFCADLDAGCDLSLDEYAAESPAEFFAVLCETFFMQPGTVKSAFPPIYQLLKEYFLQDPFAVMHST